MKKFILKFGALVALLSFCGGELPSNNTQVARSESGDQYYGYVYPTDYSNCIAIKSVPKDPPLPKNVPNATWYSGGSPPPRFSQDVRVTLYFDQPDIINKTLYQGNRAICGRTLFAYSLARTKTMHLPNPCKYPPTDAYARLACHEMGHINGWPGYHGD